MEVEAVMSDAPSDQSPSVDASASASAADPADAQASVDDVLTQAQSSVDAMRQAVDESATPIDLPDLDTQAEAVDRGIELLRDVDLDVVIELGQTEMLVEDVLKLGSGSVVELDKLAGDPVDIKVNGRLVARGEVLVLNDNFCVRVSEIVANLEEEAEAAAQQEPAGEA